MTDKPAKLLPTSRALPIALLRTREHVMAAIRPSLAKIGLTEQKWRILRVLHESGPQEQTSIAHQACLLLPSLTRILARMEEDGLISRVQDQKDRRRSIVSINPAGESIVTHQKPISEYVYTTLENKYGAEKLETLLDMLEDIQKIDL